MNESHFGRAKEDRQRNDYIVSSHKKFLKTGKIHLKLRKIYIRTVVSSGGLRMGWGIEEVDQN